MSRYALRKLRRAVAVAHRSASAVATAAWHARRRMDEARALAAELLPGSIGAPAKFADAEIARLLAQAHEVENAAYGASRQAGDLAEFMGADE